MTFDLIDCFSFLVQELGLSFCTFSFPVPPAINCDFSSGQLQEDVVQWLNSILPYLKLPPKASEDELMACLIDGTVLCNILNTLSPGSVEVVGLTSFPFDLFIFLLLLLV